MRESKRRCGAGQAPGKTPNSACIKTVDDARGSRENSNCTRMGRTWNSGIPRGQEKTFHAFNSSACSGRDFRLFNLGLLCRELGAFQRAVRTGEGGGHKKDRVVGR